jgi:hypothetical protein
VMRKMIRTEFNRYKIFIVDEGATYSHGNDQHVGPM